MRTTNCIVGRIADLFDLLFSPKGRIGRVQFLCVMSLPVVLCPVVLPFPAGVLPYIPNFAVAPGLGLPGNLLSAGIDTAFATSVASSALPVLRAALFFLVAYVEVVLMIRRYHDRGKSGWWVLVGMIAFIGPVWLLVELGFLPGTEGTNRYGAAKAFSRISIS